MASAEVQYFVEKFHSTLEEAREGSLFSQELDKLFVLPIIIEPVEISDDFNGGLWIPPLNIQGLLGPVEHWRAYTAFYGEETDFDTTCRDRYRLRRGNYRGYLWLVDAESWGLEFSCHDNPFPMTGMKEQVSTDFSVTINVG